MKTFCAVFLALVTPLGITPRSANAADTPAAQLLERASFIFRGTVQRAQTTEPKPSEPKLERAIVRVDQVVSLADGARQALGNLTGKTVNVVDSSGSKEPLKEGAQWTFYTNGLQYGDSITLDVVGRAKTTEVSIRTFQPNLFAADLIGEKTLPKHVNEADAVVTGKVMSVRPLPEPKLNMLSAAKQEKQRPPSEHDPEYREAVVQIQEALKGNLPENKVTVIFSSSRDVRWYNSPKFKEGQEGTFILHKEQVKDEAERKVLLTATASELQNGQIFTALDPKDSQPANSEKVRKALEP
jgi:hypothetical protein